MTRNKEPINCNKCGLLIRTNIIKHQNSSKCKQYVRQEEENNLILNINLINNNINEIYEENEDQQEDEDDSSSINLNN
jgi:methionyl-tRNA synthetase